MGASLWTRTWIDGWLWEQAVQSRQRDETSAEKRRFQKTELQIESLRLQDWESRRKLPLLLTLAYGFLLWLLSPPLWLARSKLLLHWCERSRLALVDGESSPVSPTLGTQPALAHPSPTLEVLAALSSTLSHHLAGLLFTLVDHSLAPMRIFALCHEAVQRLRRC